LPQNTLKFSSSEVAFLNFFGGVSRNFPIRRGERKDGREGRKKAVGDGREESGGEGKGGASVTCARFIPPPTTPVSAPDETGSNKLHLC